jgi:hypothetical protein
MKIIRLLFVALCTVVTIRADVADMVIFSYDRPLQLYALLESVEKHMRGVGEVVVVYRASGDQFKDAYALVGNYFPRVRLVAQGENPREDFKPLTIDAVFNTPSRYVIFAVDDIIMTGDVDLSKCITLLEGIGAYGFYLRLGGNLNYCYTMNQPQKVPSLNWVTGDVLSWTFSRAEFDWAYPNTVDMTVYRKKDIEPFLRGLDYKGPNTLEGSWASSAGQIMHTYGLCFQNSKMVNLPLNRVQNEWYNKSMDISASELLKKFQEGFKFDIAPLFQIRNRSAHMEYEPTFVLR